MTIIKSTYAIVNHPLKAVDSEVGNAILRAARRLAARAGIKYYRAEIPLKLLECYCDVTGERITLETLRTPESDRILWGFAAAMAENALIKLDKVCATTHTRRLFYSFTEVREELPNLYPISWEPQRYARLDGVSATVLSVSAHQQAYWSGWPVITDKYKAVYLRMAQVVHSHGPDFTERMYKEVKRFQTKRSGQSLTEWNVMFDYLALNSAKWPEDNFRTEQGVKRFMHELTRHYFNESRDSGKDAKSQIKKWQRFVTAVEKCMCKTHAWAALTSPIKRPSPDTKYGWETKIKELEGGLLVQEKLLTTIPLSISDPETMEMLFFHIKNDLSVVRKWAQNQAADLKTRQVRRTEMGTQGSPITIHAGYRMSASYSLADICATLESVDSEVPKLFLCKVYSRVTGERCDTRKLATIFGFPPAEALFAHQCLLVLEHPQITTEFLREFELYNEDGVMTGFCAEHKTLTGYKNRKTSYSREQIIHLSDNTVSIVQEIIDITAVLRKKMRFTGNDNYRHLFLTSGRAFTPISKATTTTWNTAFFANHPTLREQILAQFSQHSDLPEKELVKFITRVRLTRIRTSRAVEIYLETKNAEDMSRALGHENYYPELLSHYLPEPIMAFIKARWIRIFQKAIVCEAMKNSPNLLRATRFSNMEELHTFLENHRIKSMPPEAVDPGRTEKKTKHDNSEAVISVSVPFLATLLSLEAAVNEAPNRERVCGRAQYWSLIANKVKQEITYGYDRLLKKHLEKALQLVDARRMEDLIYVPSHWI